MKLYTEADTETVVLPGRAMRELAASVIEYFLGNTLMSLQSWQKATIIWDGSCGQRSWNCWPGERCLPQGQPYSCRRDYFQMRNFGTPQSRFPVSLFHFISQCPQLLTNGRHLIREVFVWPALLMRIYSGVVGCLPSREVIQRETGEAGMGA